MDPAARRDRRRRPQLSAYLAQRYGDEYAAWAAQTKRLFPRLY